MKVHSRRLSGLLNLFALSNAALSQTTPSSDACIWPSGFASCWQSAEAAIGKCVNAADQLVDTSERASALVGCGVAEYEGQLNCYLSDCWNEVYGCDYQGIAAELDATTLVTFTGGSIPFYPAPDNAPGGCSCNIGKLYSNFSAAAAQAQTICANSAMELTDLQYVQRCDCCAYSAALAAFYSYCPDTSSTAINLTAALATIPIIEMNGECAGLYDAASCEAQYGLAPAAGGLAISLDSLPTWTGTNALSTLGGAITSPPGGSVLTWTGVNFNFTVTAAVGSSSIATTKAASSTPMKSSNPTTTSPTGASMTTAGTATTTTATKNGSNTMVRIGRFLWILAFCGTLFKPF